MMVYNENLVNILPLALELCEDQTFPVPMVEPCLDDDSIVSTLSSDAEEELYHSHHEPRVHDAPKQRQHQHQKQLLLPPKQPRSIFQSYWKETDGSPAQRRPTKPIVSPQSPRGVEDSFLSSVTRQLLEAEEESSKPSKNIDSYENILKHMEISSAGGGGLLVSRYSSRPLAVTGRNWGGWWRASLPSLDAFQPGSMPSRMAKSESNLNSRPKTLATCLRESRYTPQRGGGGNCLQKVRSSSRTSSAVSFKQQVEVVRFEAPMESWAPEGWSSWFDYRGD